MTRSVILLVVLASWAQSADPAASPAPDADPLPPGAIARIGTTRTAAIPNAPGFQGLPPPLLLPPDYKTFAIPDPRRTGYTPLDVETGRTGEFVGPDVPDAEVYKTVAAGGNNVLGTNQSGGIVWDRRTRAVLGRFVLPPAAATLPGQPARQTVALSGDGTTLALAGPPEKAPPGGTAQDNIEVRKVGADEPRATIRTPSAGSFALSADGSALAAWPATTGGISRPTAGPGPEILFWNAKTGEPLGKVGTPAGAMSVVVGLTPDGRTAAVATARYGATQSLALYDVGTGKRLRYLLGRLQPAAAVAFSADGKTVAAVDQRGRTVERWDAASGDWLGTTSADVPPVMSSSFGGGIAFLDITRVTVWNVIGARVFAWEAPSGTPRTPVGTGFGAITAVRFADDGRTLVVDDYGATTRWDAKTGERLPDPAENGPSPRLGQSTTPDGGWAWDTQANVYNLARDGESFALPTAGTSQHQIHVSNTSAGPRAVVRHPSPDPTAADPSPDRLLIFDLDRRRLVGEFPVPAAPQPEARAAFSPDGTRVVTTVGDRRKSVITVTGWNAGTGEKLGELAYPERYVFDAEPVPVDTSTAVVVMNGKAVVVDYAAGKEVVGLPVEPGLSFTARGPVVLSPDRKRVVVTALRRSVQPSPEFAAVVYDIASGAKLAKLTGHLGPITAIAFSPDGKTLATGSADTTALVWDAAAWADR